MIMELIEEGKRKRNLFLRSGLGLTYWGVSRWDRRNLYAVVVEAFLKNDVTKSSCLRLEI